MCIDRFFLTTVKLKIEARALQDEHRSASFLTPLSYFTFSQSETFAFPEYHTVQSCISQNTFKNIHEQVFLQL